MESFQELSLPDFLGRSLKQMNFEKPTPVQAQAIPPALEGKDIIASAQTGTGKTAAFGIPLLTFLSKNPARMALILTPTRELAVQVADVLKKLAGGEPLGTIALLIGGANMGAQFSALTRKPRLVIGTPGRIIDHLNRGSLMLNTTGFLVLDEADRMLDMGFAPQLTEIRKRLTSERQTLLFSATIPNDIQQIASQYLKDPVRITVGSSTQPVTKIEQKILYTTEAKKPDALSHELKERRGSVLVFLRTQRRVDRVAHKLKEEGVKATKIHGGRTQAQRKQAIDQFREGKFDVLIATDIAARGLDIHHIAHVINYDLPRNPEDYIHRVGRTARAGAEGESLCFLTSEDRDLWNKITRLMGVAPASIPVKSSPFGFEQPQGFSQAPRPHSKGGHPGQGHSAQGRPHSQPHRHPGARPQGGHSGEPGNQAHPRRDHSGGRPQGQFQRSGHSGQGPSSQGRPTQGRPQHFGGRPQGEGQNRFNPRDGQRPHRDHGRPGGPRPHDRHAQRPFPGAPRDAQEDNRPFNEDDEKQPMSNASRDWTQKENFLQKLGRKFMGGGKESQGHRPGGFNKGKKEHFWQDDSWGQRRSSGFRGGAGGENRGPRGPHSSDRGPRPQSPFGQRPGGRRPGGHGRPGGHSGGGHRPGGHSAGPHRSPGNFGGN